VRCPLAANSADTDITMGPNLWKVATWATLLLAICGQVPAIAIPEDSKTLSDVAETKEVMSIAPLNVPSEVVNTNDADEADPVVYVALPMKIRVDTTVQEAAEQDIAANPLTAQNNLSSTDAIPFTDYAYFASTSPSYLRSPGYPNDYPNSVYNRYVIVADQGMTVQMRIDHFDLEVSSNCVNDYLVISDPNGYGSGRLCGTTAERNGYRSSGQVLNFLFRTDGSVSRTGFSITYWAQLATDCGDVFPNAWRGSLQSPGWPNDYPNNAFCTHTITAQEGQIVHIYVEMHELPSCTNCTCDYLELREPGERLPQRLCGTSNIGYEFVASGNVANVIFFSNNGGQNAGYSLIYEAVTDCGNKDLWAGSGHATLQSPGYPSDYPDRADCTYSISTYSVKRIRITVDWRDLESCCDYLEITDSSGRTSGRLSGTTATDYVFHSTGNDATVTFHSDGLVRGPGYSLRYEAI